MRRYASPREETIGVIDSQMRRVDAPGVAIIGCGRMGLPMVERLLAAAFPVRAFDTAEPALRAAAELGAVPATSPADAVARGEVLITVLPDAATVASVARAPEGILAGLPPGALWIEMTSSSAPVTRELAAAAEERGAELLDAPVIGGPAGASGGSLTVMLGGPVDRVERARPVLEQLGTQLVHVGDRPGDGDIAKTVNNMLSATNLAAAAEALALGMRAGLAPDRLMACINGGSGASHASRVKIGGHVLTGRFAAGFTIGQYLKDLHIAQETAVAHRVATPVNAAGLAVWTGLAARGESDADHSRVADLIVRDAGLRPDWNAHATTEDKHT